MKIFLKKTIKLENLKNSKIKWIYNCFKKISVFNDKENCCWVYDGYHNNGYAWVKVSNGKPGTLYRHLRMYIENRILSKDEFCCHECNNKWCVNPNHIYIGNRSENTKDMLNAKTLNLIELWKIYKGENSPNSVLTDDLVKQIRKMKKDGIGITVIAKTLNIKTSTIANVFYNYKKNRWSHVKEG
jgi:hypothetical protein